MWGRKGSHRGDFILTPSALEKGKKKVLSLTSQSTHWATIWTIRNSEQDWSLSLTHWCPDLCHEALRNLCSFYFVVLLCDLHSQLRFMVQSGCSSSRMPLISARKKEKEAKVQEVNSTHQLPFRRVLICCHKTFYFYILWKQKLTPIATSSCKRGWEVPPLFCAIACLSTHLSAVPMEAEEKRWG